MNSEQVKNRRKFQRVLFDATTKIKSASGDISAHLIDISLNGVLIQRPKEWNGDIEDKLTVSVQLGNDDKARILMDTTVAHMENGELGLHCVSIDMDSITYLRRLVELNIGDAGLLERELEALG